MIFISTTALNSEMKSIVKDEAAQGWTNEGLEANVRTPEPIPAHSIRDADIAGIMYLCMSLHTVQPKETTETDVLTINFCSI